MDIREFRRKDADAARALLISCFATPAEADLVEAIRRDGDAVIELVAPDGAALAGAVMFSRMSAPFPALGLAPLAVAATARRRGLGAALVEAGLARARAEGWAAVFVLGDPAYYGRFGFTATTGFDCPYAGPHFMMAPLAGAPAPAGRIDYAPAFAALG
ncbi:MAG: GNAT family N-acetyltransferase [Pikeienuella sp.]